MRSLTCLTPTFWPAKTVLRLIFCRPKQISAAAGHGDRTIVERILELVEAPIRARRRLVELGRVVHVDRLMRPLAVVALDEVVELGLLLKEVARRGLASFFSVRCMRSCRPFCWGFPGLMRSRRIPRRSHHTESLLSPNSAHALAKGTPLSVRMALGRPKSLNARSNSVKLTMTYDGYLRCSRAHFGCVLPRTFAGQL